MNISGHVKPLQYEPHWNCVRHQEEEEERKEVSRLLRAAPLCANGENWKGLVTCVSTFADYFMNFYPCKSDVGVD